MQDAQVTKSLNICFGWEIRTIIFSYALLSGGPAFIADNMDLDQSDQRSRPVILANIWVKPTTNCYRNEKCIFEIYNPICISEKKSSNVAWWEFFFFFDMSQAPKISKKMCVTIGK